MSEPEYDWPLADVQAWLRKHVDDGVRCPCCTQMAKVYRRKITSETARCLVLMHRNVGTEFVHLPTLLGRYQADEAKARYWGLIEQLVGEREDGSDRLGWWRLTNLGASFVRGTVSIPKYARIYDGRCLGLDESERITIQQALGTKFNYRELMEGV